MMGVVDVGYLRKWLIISILIGIVAGVGSILFYLAIDGASSLFLGKLAGYTPPSAGGEGETIFTPITRRWMIPIVCTIGGLLSGLLVFKLAPEAEGHGTDAAINSFHNREGYIRKRIPLVKLVASAITNWFWRQCRTRRACSTDWSGFRFNHRRPLQIKLS